MLANSRPYKPDRQCSFTPIATAIRNEFIPNVIEQGHEIRLCSIHSRIYENKYSDKWNVVYDKQVVTG